MKRYVLMIMVVLLLPNVFAEEIVYNPECEFPRIDLVNISLDIYGSDEYYLDLVEGRKGIAQINLIVQNNFSEFENEIWVNFIVRCFDDRRNKTADILFDGLRFDLNTTYRDKENKTFTKLVAEEKFYIPVGSNYCAIMILPGNEGGFYGYNKITHTENCKISGLPRTKIGKNIPVITESGYLTRRMLEISGKQANISQQQTEIMKESQRLEKERQFFGFDKGSILVVFAGILGTLLGFLLSDIGNYQNRKKDNIENIYEPLYDELERLKRHINKEEPIHVFLEAVKHRIEYNNLYLKDRGYRMDEPPIKPGEYDLPKKPTEWNIILHKNLSIWIPENLKNKILEFYNNDEMFHKYNESVSKKESDDGDKIEKRNMAKKDILDRISHLQKLLNDERRIGWRCYLKDKFREVLEFIKTQQ